VSVTFADNDERRVFTDNAGGLVSILNPVRTSQTRCWRGNDASLARRLGCISNRGPSCSDGSAEIRNGRCVCASVPRTFAPSTYSLNWSQSAG